MTVLVPTPEQYIWVYLGIPGYIWVYLAEPQQGDFILILHIISHTMNLLDEWNDLPSGRTGFQQKHLLGAAQVANVQEVCLPLFQWCPTEVMENRSVHQSRHQSIATVHQP